MRIYLEGGPFDGKVIDLECPVAPGGLILWGDGTLDGFIGPHPGTGSLTGWLTKKLCDPDGPPEEELAFHYRHPPGLRSDDGTLIFRLTNVTPQEVRPHSSRS